LTGICPHCGKAITFYADTRGNTIVVNSEKKHFVRLFGSGFVKKEEGYEIHSCHATGREGHVIR
jgi:hypothetical protein